MDLCSPAFWIAVGRIILIDLIVMGSRGLGPHIGALPGSVAAGTPERAAVPMPVVRG
jgi:hypothetical protein